tara:strand:+ start:195 stop:731 length:537 start_codon:yes stop_codon:yes gene_type:complete
MDPADRQKNDQFLRLFVENEEALRGFVRSLVPTLDDARDVMQEVAVVLWQKFETLDSPDNFRRWAFGVARFETLAFRRDKARDRHVFSEDLMSLLEAEASAQGQQVQGEARALEHCLTRLPQKQRALIAGAYESGTKIDDMARETGRTPMSLYKALHRIRLILADCIQNSLKQEEGLA